MQSTKVSCTIIRVYGVIISCVCVAFAVCATITPPGMRHIGRVHYRCIGRPTVVDSFGCQRVTGTYKKIINIHMMRLASRYGVPNSVPSESVTEPFM